MSRQKEDVEVLALNVQPDHVHLALRLFQQYKSLGKRYWGRHLWAGGYCVSTIGLDEEKIRKYVQWQERQERQVEVSQGKLFE